MIGIILYQKKLQKKLMNKKMTMTITLFVKPKDLTSFLEVTKILENLDIENNYVFNPLNFEFSEIMISNWIQINMDISEYLKLKYCINKFKK